MTNYPASLDDTSTLPNPSSNSGLNNPDHAGLHGNVNAAVKNLEKKVGVGDSLPAANTMLFGTGPGTSAWTQITSQQLADVLGDETGSGSAVFNNAPKLINPKVDTIVEATAGNGVTVGGVNFKDGKITGVLDSNNAVVNANIADDTITDAKLAYGLVRQRQGAANNWSGAGTANADTSSAGVFIQVGSMLVNGDPTTITFPLPFTYSPVVYANTVNVGSSTPLSRINGITPTNFSVSVFQSGNGTALTDRTINWIAIGQ